MTDRVYTPEEIETTIREARQHIASSGGKKTPGVENRRALIEIIEQLSERNDDNFRMRGEYAELAFSRGDEIQKLRREIEQLRRERDDALESINVCDGIECSRHLELKSEVKKQRAEIERLKDQLEPPAKP